MHGRACLGPGLGSGQREANAFASDEVTGTLKGCTIRSTQSQKVFKHSWRMCLRIFTQHADCFTHADRGHLGYLLNRHRVKPTAGWNSSSSVALQRHCCCPPKAGVGPDVLFSRGMTLQVTKAPPGLGVWRRVGGWALPLHGSIQRSGQLCALLPPRGC